MMSDELYPCPCCGVKEIYEPGSYEICEHCGWEDDPVQLKYPDTSRGANRMTLNEARQAYKKGEKIT